MRPLTSGERWWDPLVLRRGRERFEVAWWGGGHRHAVAGLLLRYEGELWLSGRLAIGVRGRCAGGVRGGMLPQEWVG